MKLKNIFMALLAGAFVTVGCVEEKIEHLEGLEVSNSYVGIEAKGGSTEVTFDATAAWEIDVPSSADWLTVDPLTGNEGSVKVHFSAEKADMTRKCEVKVYVDLTGEGLKKDEKGNYTGAVAVQHINVIQDLGPVDPEITPCKDVADKGENNKVYWMRATVKAITNPKYGELILEDESGILKVHGTVNENGEKGKLAEMGIEEGDILLCYGPYNKTFKNIDVLNVKSVTKALLKLGPGMKRVDIEKDGGVAEVSLIVKGEGVEVTLDENDDWIEFIGLDYNGANAVAKFRISPYSEVEPRLTEISFTSKKGKADPTTQSMNIRQIGNVPAAIKINDAVTNHYKKYVTVEGVVVGIHNLGYVLFDGTDNIYVYENELPKVEIGQELSVSGTIGDYSKFYQISNPFAKLISENNQVTYPTATEVTKDMIDGLLNGKNGVCQFVRIQGKPQEKYGGTIEVEKGYIVTPYEILSSFVYSDYFYYDDVILEGYAIQAKKGKNGKPNDLRIVVTSIKSKQFDAE